MKHVPAYKTAEELGISEKVRQGLIEVARDLANGTILPARFHMGMACGTACCIGGHLADRHVISHLESWQFEYPALTQLFFPKGPGILCQIPVLAAQAIVNFLTLGDPKWDDVMAGAP